MPAADRHRHRARPRRRPRVGQGQLPHRRGDRGARGCGVSRTLAVDAGGVRPSCRWPTRTPRPRAACSTSRTSSSSRPARWPTGPTSPTRCARPTAGSPSTSTRTSTRCSSVCSGCGWASATTCASWATPTRRSTRSPAPRPEYLTSFRERLPRRHRGAAGAVLPLHAADRHAGQRGHRPRAAADTRHHARAALAAAAPGPSPRSRRAPTMSRRPSRWPGACAPVPGRRRPGPRHRRAVPHQRPVGGARGGVRRGRRAGRAARHRAVLRPARGARGGHAAARCGARRSPAACPLGEEVRAVLGTAGWTPTPPRTAGAVRERWESLAALATLADELAAALADSLPGLRRRAGLRVPSCSTRPSPTASRWRRSTRPRAWSGRSSSSSAAATDCCRCSTPRRRRRSRRSGASPTWRSPARPTGCTCRGRGPGSRAAARCDP